MDVDVALDLHRRVPPERWCITRAEFDEFVEEVFFCPWVLWTLWTSQIYADFSQQSLFGFELNLLIAFQGSLFQWDFCWPIECWLLLTCVCTKNMFLLSLPSTRTNEGWPTNRRHASVRPSAVKNHDFSRVLEVGMQTRYPKTLSILTRCIGTHIMVQTSMILGRHILRCVPGRLVIFTFHIIVTNNTHSQIFVARAPVPDESLLCTVCGTAMHPSSVPFQFHFTSNNSNNLVVLWLSSLHLCYYVLHGLQEAWMDLGMMSARGAASKHGW